jgi:L-ascorbate metabolism protein UlaG (beta-lactamase superfamily)
MADLPNLTYVGHATVLVETAGRRVLTDPALGRMLEGKLWRHAPNPAPSTWADIDLVVISHLHHDHCDLPSLRTIGVDVPVVVPEGGGEWLQDQGFSSVRELGIGDTYVDGELTVRAVPAEHSGRRRGGPDARAQGYVLGGGGTSTYFAGDTDLFAGMDGLVDDLDVALLPVWGWGPNIGPGHLDPQRAAEAVALLRPRLAVPIHWGTFFPLGLKPFYRKRFTAKGPEFAEHVRRLSLPTEVAVTAPGRVVRVAP